MILRIAVSMYLFGLLFFSIIGNFRPEDNLYVKGWFIWEKLFDGGMFVWWSLIYADRQKNKFLIPVFIYSIFRFLLLTAIYTFGLYKNSAVCVMIMFCLLIPVTAYFTFSKDGGKAGIFLDKYLP